MKWILIGISILVVVSAAVAVIGAMLPRDHTAKVTIRLDRSAQEVWQIVADIGGWPSWNPAVTHVEMADTPADRPTWVVVDNNGRITSEVLESTPPKDGNAGRLVTRIADPELPFGGTWTWTVGPTENGCEVSVREDGEIYNVIFRFLARFVFGYTATAEAYLGALANNFGEDVTPSVHQNPRARPGASKNE